MLVPIALLPSLPHPTIGICLAVSSVSLLPCHPNPKQLFLAPIVVCVPSSCLTLLFLTQPELHDLQDPEGVAQTTVALLSQKAPEKNLQAFLDTKIAGVQAVVDALLLMHRLAATAEAPRKQRSAGSIVLLWLLLLAVCVWYVHKWRQ